MNDDLKIIDFEKRGNIVRFYLGENYKDCYGDDWDDTPYEHNAGQVYNEYIKGYIDVAWDLDCVVCEPCDGVNNSIYCKDDFKKRNIPIIVVKYLKEDEYSWNYDIFNYCFINADEKIYIGDSADSLYNKGSILHIQRVEK